MRNATDVTITQAVLDSVMNAESARARQVSEALVRHLHAFIKEVRPSREEWTQGIAFLTEVGQRCTDTRQEFILLSDTLGVSMLVDALEHPHSEKVTDSTVLGPFYVDAAPVHPAGADISNNISGSPLLVVGSVLSESGFPLSGATVDIWHADADGYYDIQKDPGTFGGRARFATDVNGRFWCWSSRPASYPIPHDGPVGRMLKAQGRHPYRPAHVHFMIRAAEHETLITHLFVAGDRYLDSDVVFGVKDTIIADLSEHDSGKSPDGRPIDKPYSLLSYEFRLRRSS